MKLCLIVGGSASGKSEYAEQLALRGPGPHVYLATMHCGDAECAARIARHRAARAGRGFVTVERELDLAALTLPPRTGTVLLEDLGNWVGNEQFAPGGAGPHTVQAVQAGVEHLLAQCGRLVIVSNEIFLDGADYPAETRTYLENLAAIHRILAARADLAAEVCAGRVRYHKGKE